MSKESSSSSSSSSNSQEANKIILIAHRGRGPTSKLSGYPEKDVPEGQAPENTLKAFKEAILQNADGIEFDIYLAKDGTPVVIHDNELNTNVAGAKRNEKDLGLVSEQTIEQLKTHNIGQGEKIPTLRETLDLIGEANKERKAKGQKNLIVNIELKGDNTPELTHQVVKEYIDKGIIDCKDVIYCSFKHEELAVLRKIDPQTQVAPGIKTAFLFGKEHVDVNAGWIVPEHFNYKPESLAQLDKLAKDLKPSMVAYDSVLWDIYQPLIDLAKENNLAIHASTSDFRNFENTDFIPFLKEAQKHVQVYFKTDEPKKVLDLLSKEVAVDKQQGAELDVYDLALEEVSSSRVNTTNTNLKRLKKPEQRVDITRVGNEEVVDKAAKMMAAFTKQEVPVVHNNIAPQVGAAKSQDKTPLGHGK